MKLPKVLIARLIVFGLAIAGVVYFGYNVVTTKDLVLVDKEKRQVIEFCAGDFTYPICKDKMETFELNRTNSVLELLTNEGK